MAHVSTEGLRGVPRSRSEQARPVALSRVRLSLDEVRASGLPAYFSDHGERLLFLDGDLYDRRDRDAALKRGSPPQPLPRQLLESGVGIEYGWRHTADCACPVCWKREQPGPDHAAVA